MKRKNIGERIKGARRSWKTAVLKRKRASSITIILKRSRRH